jgi:HAD superfamily hydrolase (TIGR01450 family)
MGVEVDEDSIVTAGMSVAALAAEAAGPGGSAFVIGAEPLKEMVAASGPRVLEGEAGREAGVVVVSGHRGFDYAELLTAKLALDGGAALVATSRDPTMPMPGGEWPGTGSILAAVETASGKVAEIGGKPERHLFELAIERTRGSFFASEVRKEPQDGPRLAMVGDRVSSDIEGGRRAGLATVLVLSGTTDREAAATADPAPDHVLEDLAGLLS